jgi:ATP-dependent protease ClpP protease subunit
LWAIHAKYAAIALKIAGHFLDMPKRKRHRRCSRRNAKTDSESDSDGEPEVIAESLPVANRISFWCSVTKQSALDLIRKLTAAHLATQQIVERGDSPPPIYININSNGGDLEAALGVIDAIQSVRRAGATVVTTVQGTAASAATLISTAATTRRISRHSTMRVHQLSSGLFGKKGELDDEHSNLSQMESLMFDIYKKQTRMTVKEIRKLMSRELDLLPTECLEKGLVDEII